MKRDTMNRRELLAAAAGSGIGLLAGCSSTGDSETSPTATQASPVPSLDEVSYPSGYSSSGVTDVRAAVDGHRQYVMDLSNYKSEAHAEYGSQDDTAGLTDSSMAVDVEGRRILWEYTDHRHDKEIYFADGTLYVYDRSAETTVNPEETSLFQGEPPGSFEEVAMYLWPQLFSSVVRPTELSASTVERREGSVAIVYDVTGLTDEASASWTDPSGTFIVLREGGVRSIEFSYLMQDDDDAQEERSTWRSSVTNVGETTVSQPNWVS